MSTPLTTTYLTGFNHHPTDRYATRHNDGLAAIDHAARLAAWDEGYLRAINDEGSTVGVIGYGRRLNPYRKTAEGASA